MSENESNEIKRTIWDINCKYIIIQIFKMLNRNMFLKIMQYNLYLQKMFNVNLSDYKKHLETEIEIIPIDNEKGQIFYIRSACCRLLSISRHKRAAKCNVQS